LVTLPPPYYPTAVGQLFETQLTETVRLDRRPFGSVPWDLLQVAVSLHLFQYLPPTSSAESFALNLFLLVTSFTGHDQALRSALAAQVDPEPIQVLLAVGG
jgi:hypothetical protein